MMRLLIAGTMFAAIAAFVVPSFMSDQGETQAASSGMLKYDYRTGLPVDLNRNLP